MPNYWMLTCSRENFLITQKRGFSFQGMKARHKRKIQRMQRGDRLLYYLSNARAFPATATVLTGYREDHTPVWDGGKIGELYPLRVDIRSEFVLEEGQWLDARQLGPTLEYTRKWPPELWPLAFVGELHLLSQRDFRLLEEEIRKVRTRQDARTGQSSHQVETEA